MGPCMSTPSTADKKDSVGHRQTQFISLTTASSRAESSGNFLSSPKGQSTGSSHQVNDTTMSRTARANMLDPVRTDVKTMSTIYDEEDDHDQDRDSAYGSAASPGMSFYAASAINAAKPAMSMPLSSNPPRMSSISSQHQSRPRVASRTNSHTTIASPTHSRSPSSQRIFDGSTDPNSQHQGFGYSVTITGTYNQSNRPDRERPRSSGSQSRRRKEKEDILSNATPEQVFGLDPISDSTLNRSANQSPYGSGAVVAAGGQKVMTAYERRMAKRDQFTQSFIPGQT